MNDNSEDISNDIMKIASRLAELSEEAVVQYRSLVNSILNEEITDLMEIERIMDGMLDFCDYDNMLSLFKELCRGLYVKHPKLVYNYISFYREMWEIEQNR